MLALALAHVRFGAPLLSPLTPPSRTRWLMACLSLGFTGFGGGLSILGQAGDRFTRRGWVSERDWVHTLTLSLILPGGAATNAIAHLGRKLFGVGTSLLSVAAYVLPSSLLMIALAVGWTHARSLTALAPFLSGLSLGVVGLVATVTLRLSAQGLRRTWQALAAVALSLLAVRGLTLPLLLALGAFLGLALELVQLRHRVRVARAGHPALLSPRQRRLFGPPPLVLASWPVLASLPALPVLVALFWTFLHIGSMAWGGGYAAVALLEHEAVDIHAWVSRTEFADALALGQVTPGPVLVCASFIGARAAGVSGGLSATLGIFLGPALLVALLGGWLELHRRERVLRGLLAGLVPAVAAAMAHTVLRLGIVSVHGWIGGLIASAVFVVAARRWLDPALAIVAAGLLGWIASLLS